MSNKPTFVYSEAFKLQVIREIESGQHTSCIAAAEAYGIKGKQTVYNWIEKFGKSFLKRRVIRVETPEERSELRRLKDRVRELEKTLSDTTIDLHLEREYVKIACHTAGIKDVETFKKKARGSQRTDSSK